MRVVGDVLRGRLGGHHVRVQRALHAHRPQQRAERTVLLAILRAQGAAEVHRVVEAGAHAAHGQPDVREDPEDGGGQRGGDFILLRGRQRRIARKLHGQARFVPRAAVVHRLQRVLEQAVLGAGILARLRQRVGVDERVERRVRRVMRQEAAAVGAGERTGRAGLAQRQQEFVGALGVDERGHLRRGRAARHGREGEEQRVGALRPGEHGAAQGLILKEGQPGARPVGDALVNIGCRHDAEPPVKGRYERRYVRRFEKRYKRR